MKRTDLLILAVALPIGLAAVAYAASKPHEETLAERYAHTELAPGMSEELVRNLCDYSYKREGPQALFAECRRGLGTTYILFFDALPGMGGHVVTVIGPK